MIRRARSVTPRVLGRKKYALAKLRVALAGLGVTDA